MPKHLFIILLLLLLSACSAEVPLCIKTQKLEKAKESCNKIGQGFKSKSYLSTDEDETYCTLTIFTGDRIRPFDMTRFEERDYDAVLKTIHYLKISNKK